MRNAEDPENESTPPTETNHSLESVEAVLRQQGIEAALQRGGSVNLAKSVFAKTGSIEQAAKFAATTGKGHAFEAASVTSFSMRAGAQGRAFFAELNPDARDPLHDILIHDPATGVVGVQAKLGTDSYVSQACRSHAGPILTASDTAGRLVPQGHPVVDHIAHDGVVSQPFSRDEIVHATVDVLVTSLEGRSVVDAFRVLAHSANAGGQAAAGSMAWNLVGRAVLGLLSHAEIDWRTVLKESAVAAASQGAKTFVETLTMLLQASGADVALAGHVVHRVASGMPVTRAIAHVIVETALDFVKALQGRITWEAFFRLLGVHTCEAIGIVLCATLALAATTQSSAEVRAMAVTGFTMVGYYGGGEVGRRLTPSDAPREPRLPPGDGRAMVGIRARRRLRAK